MKAQRIELIEKIQEVVNGATKEPADELIELGEALAEVGRILKGRPMAECRAILKAVAALSDVDVDVK